MAIRLQDVMRKPIDDAGFTAPAARPLGNERRIVAFAELIAILALALSTIVVGTVVSVGIARADAITGVIDDQGSLFGIALLLGLVFLGLAGFSLLPRRGRPRH
jgi:hypothetical protein